MAQDIATPAVIACREPWELSRRQPRPNVEPTVNDDATLITDALRGNTDAFGQLVCRYQDRLYNATVHLVGSCDEAYDVVQDAFVQAFVKLPTFEGASAFYTWLYRIAFNLAISRRRRKRPTLSVEHTRETTGEEPLEASSPEDALQRDERVQQVQQGLAALSEEHRAILIMREMEGFSYETIAELLDVPIGTVRSRLNRARMQLREQLKEVMQEDVK